MAGKRITDLLAGTALAGGELIEISQLSEDVTITGITISAAAADNSFNDSANGFVAAGFAVGDRVNVAGFTGNVANNLRAGVIATLAAGKITIEAPAGDLIVDDAAGESVTIAKWVSRATTPEEIAALAAGEVEEAPEDGSLYARKDGAWEEFEPGSGGGGGGGTVAKGVVLTRAANLAVGGNATVTIPFTAEVLDENSYWSAAAPTDIVFVEAGWYICTLDYNRSATAPDQFEDVDFYVNGVKIDGQRQWFPSSYADSNTTAPFIYRFAANDVLTIKFISYGTAGTFNGIRFAAVPAGGPQGEAGPAGGGPYELIANNKLVADGAFPVIDVTGFRSVVIYYNLKKAGGALDISGATFRFNGDATGVYYAQNGYTTSNAAGADGISAGATSGQIALLSTVDPGNTKLSASGSVEFEGLDSATLDKGWIARNSAYRNSDGKVYNYRVAGFYNKTDVVNSITILENFAAGSSIQVLGIRADAAPSAPNRGFDVRAAAEVTAPDTAPVIAGFGIASVVLLATGIFQINFTEPMPDTNYLVTGSGKFPNGAANGNPAFGLSRNTNLLGGLIGKQLNYCVIDLYTNGGAFAVDSFDIIVGYPVAYTGTSRDGLLGRAFSHTMVSGANSAAVEDIPGMSVTFTMPVAGEIELDFDVVIGRASGTVRLFIQLDGVDIVNAVAGQVAYNAIGMAEHGNLSLKGKQIYAMTAGVHTLKLRTSAVASVTPADYKDRSMVVRRIA